MKWLALVLLVAAAATGCGDEDKADPSGPTGSFSTPADGSVRISQGTTSQSGGLEVGVGGVLKNPDKAMLSVRKAGAESVQLTLGIGEKGTAFGQTVTVTAVEFGEHDYAWVKVTPA